MSTYESFIGFIRTAGKVLTFSSSGTLAGGDGYTLAIAASKTLTVSNSLEFAGSDSTTMTFPATSATVAGLGITETFTAPQRGTVTTDNDLSFDFNVTNNFQCTPSGTGALTFTNITAGQSGNIWLDNSGAYAISLAATTKGDANLATTISAAGIYWLSYYSPDGTNVYVVTSAVFA